MGQKVSRDDYAWVYTEEPHATRRKEILAKYPDVKQLMGSDPNIKWKCMFMVVLQILAAWYVQSASWGFIWLLGYCFGGVINHSLTLGIHELSHNLGFGHSHSLRNRVMAMIANLPLGIPYCISFKKYHLEHHKYQGDDEYDVDVPSRLEAKLFHRTGTKLIWVILQPFFYALRPLAVRPKAITQLEVLNILLQVLFDSVIVYFFGWRSLIYLSMGTFLAMGLHPMAGHFISEHYMFKEGYETYSYYGPMNMICFNVGYHNEHHDFPNIPGCNLPKLKAMAPEYYDNLPSHSSWTSVIWKFITDPTIGCYSRVKRRRLPVGDEVTKNGEAVTKNGVKDTGSRVKAE